jgi:hypothetical protein
MQPLGQHHQEFTMLNWLPTSRLRPVLTVLGLSGLLALAACGGGSGAPNNPYSPNPGTPPLQILPAAVVAYSGVPTTVTITSGVAPFFAFTNNAAVLPVTQNVAGNTIVLLPNQVTADVIVILTVQDSANQTTTVAVTVKASPIFNSLTFAPSGTDCGTNLCSGQKGSATVIATGPGGVPLASRQMRFDVIFGAIGFVTGNPGTPLVQTQLVTTDVTGKATAVIQAVTNATTQPAQIRVTDTTSGQSQIANFTVQNSTTGVGSPLTVIPGTATITGGTSSTCSSGFRIDYYIYGGNPPYTVSSTFPGSVILSNTPVLNSGGFFEATTNGACVNPLTFTIVDSAGKQTTALLNNTPGSGTPPTPGALALTPSTVAEPTSCAGKTYSFIVSGGLPPYNVTQVTNPSVAGVTVAPMIVSTNGGSFAITYPAVVGTVTTNIVVVDSNSPSSNVSGKITCP